jgi:hypothetical protein
MKNASPLLAIREPHNTDTFLDSLPPQAHVSTSVGPLHYTISLPFIFDILADVLVS